MEDKKKMKEYNEKLKKVLEEKRSTSKLKEVPKTDQELKTEREEQRKKKKDLKSFLSGQKDKI